MVWVDHVLSGDQASGSCRITLNPKAHYCSETSLRQSSLIEWIAQSFGYVRAAVTDLTSSRAYLAAVRDVEFCEEKVWNQFACNLKEGDTATVHVKILRTLSPITLAAGEVYGPEGTLLVKASFKLYIESETRSGAS